MLLGCATHLSRPAASDLHLSSRHHEVNIFLCSVILSGLVKGRRSRGLAKHGHRFERFQILEWLVAIYS
jgi:hypothetical protein